MKIELREEGSFGVGKVLGDRLDVKSVGEFKLQAESILAGERSMILDLEKVSFVDSTGLGALLSLLRSLVEQERELRLCALQDQVSAMFRLVRMHRLPTPSPA
ncbi:MAG: STAS domain-containing protein [Planctomycetota bacterium]